MADSHSMDGENETLRTRLQRGDSPLSDLTSLTVALRVAAAMQAAHENGRAHGALSPTDVVLLGDDEMPEVRVLGWTEHSEARARSDANALAGLLFSCLANHLPPFARRTGEDNDPPRFDDPRWHWDEVDVVRAERRLGRFKGRPPGEGFPSVEAAIAHLRPAFDHALAKADGVTREIHRELRFAQRVLDLRERRALFAERVARLDAWFADNEEVIDRCHDHYAAWRARHDVLERLRRSVLGAPPAQGIPVDDAWLASESMEAYPEVPADEAPALPQIVTPQEARPLLAAQPTEVVARRNPEWLRPAVAAALVLGALTGAAARLMAAPEPGQEHAVERPQRAQPADKSPAAPSPAAEPEATTAAPEPMAMQESEIVFDEPIDLMDAALPPPAPVAQTDAPESPSAEEPPRPEAPMGMVVLPAGAVRTPDGEQAVAAFAIDRLEVSQRDYLKCRHAGRCELYRKRWDDDDHPATSVTREMAAAYCEYRGARLPTAEEWLYAGRGDGDRPFPWGKRPQRGRDNSLNRDGYRYVAPVGAFARSSQSEFGVAGLAGNVREWTASTVEGQAVVVGGSYRDRAREQRLDRRSLVDPSAIDTDLGFRCARDL